MNVEWDTESGEPREAVKWVRRVFVPLGLLFFGIGCYFLYETHVFLQTARQVAGEVVFVERKVSRDSDGTSVTYRPVFRFEDETGATREAPTYLSSGSYDYAVGERVAILYAPDEPRTVRVDGVFSIWVFGGLFAFMGALFALVGAFLRGGPRSGATPLRRGPTVRP